VPTEAAEDDLAGAEAGTGAGAGAATGVAFGFEGGVEPCCGVLSLRTARTWVTLGFGCVWANPTDEGVTDLREETAVDRMDEEAGGDSEGT